MSTITIDTGDGAMTAYLALPPGGTGPGIVLIQEIFGVNQVMRDSGDGLAARATSSPAPTCSGASSPASTSPTRPRPNGSAPSTSSRRFDVDQGVRRSAAPRSTPCAPIQPCTGKVGTVGYCLGGKLAYLMAARTDADAASAITASASQDLLADASQINKPLMLHIAGQDQFTPPEAQAKIHAALDRHPQVTIHNFPPNDHAFARVGGEHYDLDEAQLANGRTCEFFKRHLG